MIDTYKTPKDVPQKITQNKRLYELYDLVQAKKLTRKRIDSLDANVTIYKPVSITATVDHHWVAIYQHLPKRTRK
jgi:hypothetical protein